MAKIVKKVVPDLAEILGNKGKKSASGLFGLANFYKNHLIVAVIGVMLSLTLVISIVDIRRENHQLNNFLPIEATIIDTQVQARYEKNSDGWTDYIYEPYVIYQYKAHDGRTYTSAKIFPGSIKYNFRGDYTKAERYTMNFVIGESITAYYNPDNPSQAYLIRQRTTVPYFIVMFFFVVIATPLVYGLFNNRA